MVNDMENITKRSYIKTKLIIFVLLLALAFMFGPITLKVHASSVQIDSWEAFNTYSQEYSASNKDDVITISIQSGGNTGLEGFKSLGTQAAPFNGTIQLPNIGNNTFYLYDCPLFDYVTTNAKIRVGTTNVVNIVRLRATETKTGALFANHVIKATPAAQATWNINLLDNIPEGANRSSSYEGLIKDIAADCDVTINFANGAEINELTSSSNIGLICGTLGERSKLTVTTSGTGSNISVKSTGGKAGGLVGQMKAGSQIVLNNNSITRVNSVESSNDDAGGLVGSADDIKITTPLTDFTFSNFTVKGKNAGGLFGYFKNVHSGADYLFDANNLFSLENSFDFSGLTINGSNNAGVLFGSFNNQLATSIIDGNTANSEVIGANFTHSSGYYGGLIGNYKSNYLTNSMEIRNTKTAIQTSSVNGGGFIGRIEDGTSNTSYIHIHDVETETTSTSSGAGLIGNMGNSGSFLDVGGNITVGGTGRYSAGLVDNISKGVLRIKGTTDLSDCEYIDWNRGQLVRSRQEALIYALGTGEDNNWKFYRGTARNIGPSYVKNTSKYQDDIFSWGNIIRIDGEKLTEAGLFTVDNTNHTVTIKSTISSNTVTINNLTDFAITALNMQLNKGSDVGALKFASSNNYLSSTINLTADIDITGTGFTSFTKDNYAKNTDPDYFSGTFNGNYHTITYNIGKSYGYMSDKTTLCPQSSNQGAIVKHRFMGLFAGTNGATFNNLTISGNIYTYISSRLSEQNNNNTGINFVGALSATSKGDLTINNVTIDDVNLYAVLTSSHTAYVGGLIGYYSGDNFEMSMTSSSINANIYANNRDQNQITSIGGVIGYLDYGTSQNISIEDSEINLLLDADTNQGFFPGDNINKTTPNNFGGIIGEVYGTSYPIGSNEREINIDNVDLTLDVKAVADSNNFGGIIGHKFIGVTTVINDLEVKNSTIKANRTSKYGGLFQVATGHIDIQDLTITACEFDLVNSGTFGFVCNEAFDVASNTSLYLEVDNANYDIANLSFKNNSVTFTDYDELVYDSRFDGNSITSNHNAIISITTGNSLDSTHGAYLAKTSYGKDTTYNINNKTRYYYNVKDAITNKDTNSSKKFYLWTIYQYAHSSINDFFNVNTNTFSGTINLVGLSYYPINLETSLTLDDAVITIDNKNMHTYVLASSDTLNKRSTRATDNQHYLMHCSLFLNVSSNLTISGSSSISGYTPILSDNSGILVLYKVGDLDTSNVKLNIEGLTLDGAYIFNADGTNYTSGYAPLLINKIGYNTTSTLSGIRQNYSGSVVAGSSLIGDVGSNTSRAIIIRFTDIKLDARNNAIAIGNLNTAYGTNKSIFTRSTFLNSFQYLNGSSATYNFTLEEDWDNDADPSHNVTYGFEISGAEEFSQKDQYANGGYVNPVTKNTAYDFSDPDNFLPYVYVGYENYYHEISVNQTVDVTITGAGKYGDPYIINDGDQLKTIAKIINDEPEGGAKIELPLNTNENNRNAEITGLLYTNGTNYEKVTFTYNSSSSEFEATDETSIGKDVVRAYLMGAYYQIGTDIELDNDYPGLGKSVNSDIVFKGVIVGAGSYTITNKSPNPLIYNAAGVVLKNLTVIVDTTNTESDHKISLTANSVDKKFGFTTTNTIAVYGGIIGQVLGGDNIIDNVGVEFDDDVRFTFTSDSNGQKLIPIGGYIGAIVNGGVIFRNMTNKTGLTSTTILPDVGSNGYLYRNPFIGRVISGYSFHEVSGNIETGNITLDNGNKNYAISDINVTDLTGNNMIGFSYASSKLTINIKNGAHWYLLGAILNSGGGSASYNNTTEQAYDAFDEFYQAYNTYAVARGTALYNDIGSFGDDCTSAGNDNYANNLIKIPYIIRKYTSKTGNVYLARTIGTASVNIVVSNDCDIPSGFKGLGNIYTYTSTKNIMKLVDFNGNNHTITLNMFFNEYNNKLNNSTNLAYIAAYKTSNAGDSNNLSPASGDHRSGFGLFNLIDYGNSRTTNIPIYDVTLSGNISYDVFNITEASQSAYEIGFYGNTQLYYRGDSPNTSGSGTSDGYTISDKNDIINYPTNLSVGGLIGIMEARSTITDVLFDGLTVNSAKTAGGIVGMYVTENVSDGNKIAIIYTSGTENPGIVNVTGTYQAGGLMGLVYKTYITVNGDSTNNTSVKIGTIDLKGKAHEVLMQYGANIILGSGGLFGSVSLRKNSCASINNNDYKIYAEFGVSFSGVYYDVIKISNMTVTKGDEEDDEAVVSVSGNDNTIVKRRNGAGGFIGSLHNMYVEIIDSKLIDVSVKANMAGGLIGYTSETALIYAKGIEINTTGTSSIEGTRFAGGLIGMLNERENSFIYAGDVVINNYIIKSTYTGSDTDAFASGGLIGMFKSNNKVETIIKGSSFANIKIAKCTIESHYQATNGKYNGTGGLFGTLAGGSNKDDIYDYAQSGTYKPKVSGYNILLEHNTIKHYKGENGADFNPNNCIALIAGNNTISAIIRLVGVSVQNTTANLVNRIVGKYNVTTNEFGTSTDSSFTGSDSNKGYVIFADYKGLSTNTSASVNGEVGPRSPYVTVNPSLTLGSTILTGDAVASTKEGLAIADILSDSPVSNIKPLYNYILGTTSTSVSDMFENMSTFQQEISTIANNNYVLSDFPIMIVEDTDEAKEFIDAYIKTLTNTNISFNGDISRIFGIDVYNMVYSNSDFDLDNNGASLKYNSYGFNIKFTDFDSGKLQLSLVDVKFYDPYKNNNTVAYHLYIPVFVKKVMSYKFNVAVLSGTTYLDTEYQEKYGQILIENIGTPVTTYFEYDFDRSASDWIEAINGGENIIQNYNKYLYFYKANATSEKLSYFADDTIFTLLDPISNMVYYGTYGSVKDQNNSNVIDLSKFSKAVYSNGTISYTGDPFVPQTFNDMMEVTVVSTNKDDGGVLVKLNNSTGATVRDASGNYYRLATEEELEADSGLFKATSVTLNNDDSIIEKYYLSIFTEQEDIFHYFTIQSPQSFTGIGYPSKMLEPNASHSTTRLILGNIFFHTNVGNNFTLSSNSKLNTEIMSSINNELNVAVNVTLGINEDLDNIIKNDLTDFMAFDNIKIYQSFMVNLERKDNLGTTKIIVGLDENDGLSGTYSIDSGAGVAYSNIIESASFIGFVTGDISSNFATGDNFTISSLVKLKYSEGGIANQFPGRNQDYKDNGVSVSAVSSLAFSVNGTSYSKNRINKNDSTGTVYYSDQELDVATLDLNPLGNKVGDFTSLGINALNPSDITSSHFILLAVLNTSTIRYEISDYTAMKITFILSQKQTDNQNGTRYVAIPSANIGNYLNSIKVGDLTVSGSSITISKTQTDDGGNLILNDNGADIIIPEITINVKTGSALESGNYFYTNYRLDIEVELFNNQTAIGVSRADNYIIYTNAKVIPGFID